MGGGEYKPWKDADWTTSWKRGTVSESEWRTLRDNFRREPMRGARIAIPRDLDEREAGWMIGSIAHLAYHLGAIRQIDRAARGPTAEDERPFQQVVKATFSVSKSQSSPERAPFDSARG